MAEERGVRASSGRAGDFVRVESGSVRRRLQSDRGSSEGAAATQVRGKTYLTVFAGVLVIACVGLVLWGALQEHDPFYAAMHHIVVFSGLPYSEPFFHFAHSAGMRHLVGFGVLGVAASIFPGRMLRAAAVAALLALTVGLEIAQELLTAERSMSLTDMFHSVVGLMAGFGAGTFLLTLGAVGTDIVRDLLSQRARALQPAASDPSQRP